MVSVLVFMVLFLQPELSPAPEQQILIDNLQLYGGLLGLAAVVSMGIFFALTSQKESHDQYSKRLSVLHHAQYRSFFMRLFDGFVKGLGNSTDTSGLWLSGILSVGMWLNGAFAIFCLFKAFF